MITTGFDPRTPPLDEADALARLRAGGGRITESRRQLVAYFFADGPAVTAEELAAAFPAVDPATIYRTVNALEQAGIVEHTHLGHGPATYRRAGGTTIPVVCETCGARLDLPRKEFDTFASRLQAAHGFRIALHHFAITGTCAHCGGPQEKVTRRRPRRAGIS